MSQFLRRLTAPRRPASARTPRDLRARLLLSSLEEREVPATFTVTGLGDAGTGSGSSGDLRYCLTQANLDAVADTIVFQAGVTGTINVATQLSVTQPVTITGPGAGQLTINSTQAAGTASRVFNLALTTAGGAVAMSGVTISGGNLTGANKGGGINNTNAALQLTDVTVTNNRAASDGGGINVNATTSTLTLTNSRVTNNTVTGSGYDGGGINVQAATTVTITNSTISGNTAADDGGGIYFFSGGTLNMTGSTVSGNTVPNGTAADGGGAYLFGTTTTIRNSTFSGNSAGRGGAIAIKSSDNVTITNSTIAGNVATSTGTNASGGITRTSAGTTTIESTVVALNTGGVTNGNDFSITNNALTANFSFIGNATGLTITGGNNQTGTTAAPLNPQITGLQDNGGLTFTRGPLPGSPLLNTGSNPASLGTDQRGLARVQGPQTDIGAVEGAIANPSASLTAANVTTPGAASYSFTVTYTAVSPALMNVSTIGTGDVTVSGPGFSATPAFVSATPNTNSGTITATYSFVPPGGTWDSADNGTYTISMVAGQVTDTVPANVPGGALGSFTVGVPLVVTVTNANDSGAGSLRDAITQVNAAASADFIQFDPAFFATPRTITLATALPAVTGVLTITGPGAQLLTVSGNNAVRVFSSSATTLTMSGMTLTGGNVAAADGAGLLVSTGTAYLDGMVITGNTVTGAADGGGIGMAGTTFLSLKNSTVSGNIAGRRGGGIYFLSGGGLVVENSTISGNAALGATTNYDGGGGIYFFGTVSAAPPTGFTPSTLVVRNSTIANNTATRSGGAVMLEFVTGTLLIQNSTITGNSASATAAGYGGGGIGNDYGSPTITVQNSVVSGNTNGNGPDILSAATVNVNFSAVGSSTGFTPSGTSGNNLAFGANLMLGTLGNNGGPTQTILPQTGSPLINAGSNALAAGLTTDQRGVGGVRIYSASGTQTVDIGAIEVQPLPPVITVAGATLTYTENAPALVLDSSLTVADLDSTNLTGATVQITAGLGATDVLAAATVGGITAVYSAGTGLLTLSGTSTLANYQTVLRSVTFIANGESPAPGNRTITITATDPSGNVSTAVTKTVNVVSVNDPPVIGGLSGTINTPDNVTVSPFSTATVTDLDAASVTVTVGFNAANGTATATAGGVASAGGFSFTGTPAASQAALRGLQFTPNVNQAAFGASITTPFTATVTDDFTPTAGTATDNTTTVVATNVNDAPSFTAADPAASLEDGGPQSVAFVTAFNPGSPSESSQTVLAYQVEVLTNGALFSAAPAVSNAGVLTYTTAADANGTATVRVRVQDNGGTAGGGIDLSAWQTFTISVTAVNDAPTFSAADPPAVPEDAGAQTVAGFVSGFVPGPADEAGQTALGYEVEVLTNPALFTAAPAVSAAGVLTYTAAADANGTATFRVRVQDSGGTANGGVDLSGWTTFTISVTAVNDAPSFTAADPPAVPEDAGAQAVSGFVSAVNFGPANEATQTVLGYEVEVLTGGALFAAPPAVDPAGQLTYTTALDANGTATFRVRVQDSGGTANGGVDRSGWTAFTLTVTAVNDNPINSALTNVAVATGTSTRLTGLSVSDPADGVAGTTPGYTVTVSAQSLAVGTFSGSLFTSGDGTNSISVTGTLNQVNAALADLFFTPAQNGGTVDITVTSSDGGNTGSGGALGDTDLYTLTIKAKPVVATGGGTTTFTEDLGAVAVAPGLTLTDSDSTDLSLAVVRISGAFLPGEDVLAYTGSLPAGVSADTSVAGQITFSGVAPIGAYEALLRTVTYANTNQFPDLTTRTFTFVVTDEPATSLVSAPATRPVAVVGQNDAPVNALVVGSPVTGEEQTVAAPGVSVSDVDLGAAPLKVTVSAVDGVLNVSTAGVTVTNNNTTQVTIEGPVAAVNASLATLTFNPATDFTGSAIITIRSDDQGATHGPAQTDTDTFTITVFAINDAPSFSPGPNILVNEDAGFQTFAAWATNISPGPADESGQTVSFLVSNNLPGVFTSAPAIAPNGTLTFAARTDAVGVATVTVRVQDSGGTAFGGVNVSAPRTFTITLNPVNDTPVFTAGTDISVTEDSGPRTFAGWARGISTGPVDEFGQTVTFLVSNDNPGLFTAGGQPAVSPDGTLTFTGAPDKNGEATVTVRVKDSGGGADTSPPQTFKITLIALNDPPRFHVTQAAISAGPGTATVTLPGFVDQISAGPADEAGQTMFFEVTNNGEVLFSQQPAITPDGTLTFAPAAFRSGVATVTVRLRDDGGDTFGVDVTPPVQTFTITINGSNSAPSFTAGPNQAVLEDAGAQSVSGWATNLSPGLPTEAGQTLTFLVTNSLPALFAVQPAVAADGTLTYTPAADAVGTASVTVRVMDNGGTAFGGVDTSGPQSFTITLNPVNDAPRFTIPSGAVPADPRNGPRTVSGFATGIAAGPANETGQALTFQVANNSNALFTTQPAINPVTGALTFTPATGANGTATVTVRLQDNAGTANGGVNISAPQTFTIQVAVDATNSPPTAANDAVTVAYGSGATVVNVLGNDGTAPDTGETLTVTAVGTAAHGTAALVGGVVSYTPAAGFSGSDSFTYTISDGNGGTATGTVAVTVSPKPADLPKPSATVTADLVTVTNSTEPRVRVVNVATGAIVADFIAFPGFRGGVNATVADVTGDGVADVIVGAGAGGGPVVKVFDGRTFGEVASFHAFLPSLRGGVHVAAGDVNGDGVTDLVLGAGSEGGPHVKVVDGTRLNLRDENDLPAAGALLGSFFAYASTFTGGVNVAAGDLDGDGRAEVVTGAGPGGSPHVKVYAGGTLREILSVIPYTPEFRGGVNVAVGDLDGDGKAEIITGAAAGGGPHVGIYDGLTAASKGQFFAFAPSAFGGVTVAVRPLSAGGAALVAASGDGGLRSFATPDFRAVDLLDGVLLGGIAVG